MLRGYIDSVTSLGYVEGWAFDTEHPAKALEVSVLLGSSEVAWGLAHLFRTDLMEASYGVGWCAYRLRLRGLTDDFLKGPARLMERSTSREICAAGEISFIEDPALAVTSVEGIALTDPTIITGVWQLKKCAPLFMTFIGRHGIEGFLSVAYAYVLGRPVDADGLSLYTRCLRQATLSPLGVLEALEKSEEFHAVRRTLAAPSSASFPFAC